MSQPAAGPPGELHIDPEHVRAWYNERQLRQYEPAREPGRARNPGGARAAALDDLVHPDPVPGWNDRPERPAQVRVTEIAVPAQRPIRVPEPEPPDPDDLAWLAVPLALRALLHREGVTRISELCAMRPEDLRDIGGLGPGRLMKIRTALKALGMTLAPSALPPDAWERREQKDAYQQAYRQEARADRYALRLEERHLVNRSRAASAALRVLDQREYAQTRDWLREHGHILWDDRSGDSGDGTGTESPVPASEPGSACWCGAVHPAGWVHTSGAAAAYPPGTLEGGRHAV